MKKHFSKIAILLVICLCLPLFAACDKNDKTSAEEFSETEAKTERMTENETETETETETEAVQYSQGLEFTSNGDGTCYVSGIGTCTDTDLVVPPVSPAGDAVIAIGIHAFAYCYNLTNIYYAATATKWNDITIGSDNTVFTDATRYYYSETEPTASGNYWHYDENGEISVW